MTDKQTMENLLVGYADGELDAATTTEVEAYIAANPDAERMLALHRETTALLRADFAESLYAKGPTTVAPTMRPRRPVLRRWMATAAAVMLAVLGYGAGAIWPDLLMSARPRMLSEVAEYHAVYSRETSHLVEVPASQIDHLKAWLGRRIKGTLVIPDFSAAGLTFARGRMVVIDGAPVAELMYTRADGLPIGFCMFWHDATPSPILVERREKQYLATWDDGKHGHIVVGGADRELIHRLATTAKQQI
ncbi:MAG: anti-sigma factor [Acetobacteraceae bacterium]|nr:anti-sigma factor [Acetobacteraceae bacterium]